MARKKKEPELNKKKVDTSGVVGLVGSTTEQAISETLGEVSGSTIVGTGMVVKLLDGNTVKATATIIVTGDTNGDGKTTITDMLAV